MSFLRTERRDAVATGSPTYNPFENPAVPLQSVGFDNVWSMSNNDAGQQVTPITAATAATFYRCLFLLSSVIAGCPLEVYRKRDLECIPNPLFDEANDELTYTPFEYMQLVVIYRLVWGNAYVFKKRDANDNIVDLKPIYPDLVQPKIQDGEKVFLVKHIGPDGEPDNTRKPQVFSEYEVMHIPSLGYDGLSGLSLAKLMSQTMGIVLAADKLAARFYSRGTQLGGILKVKAPLRSQTQAEGIKQRWMSKNAGVANAGDVAILDAETDFQDVTIPPDQLQFLESRRWGTIEVARWFGVPPHLVGDVEKSTSWGSGIETQNIGLDTFTLQGHFKPIAQRHTREVVQIRGQYAKFCTDELRQGTLLERYQALSVAVGGPWMSRTEARNSEGRKPIEGHPEYDELLPPQGIGPEDPQNAPGGANNPKVSDKPKGSQDN